MRWLLLLLLAGCRQLAGFEELAPVPTPDPDGPAPIPDTIVDTSDSPDVPADMISEACPATYTALNGSFYRVIANAETWMNAMTDCADDATTTTLHTHLVVFAGDAERVAVAGLTTGVFWFGITDRNTEMSFIPITDEVVNYPPASGAPWGTNQPDDLAAAGEDCAVVEANDQLFDRDCAQSFTYICECDAFPADPDNF